MLLLKKTDSERRAVTGLIFIREVETSGVQSVGRGPFVARGQTVWHQHRWSLKLLQTN